MGAKVNGRFSETLRSRIVLLRDSSRFAQSPAIAAFSQMLGLVQLVLLLTNSVPSSPINLYLYLLAFMQLPVQIFVIGTLYPKWVRDGFVSNSTLRIGLIATPLLSIITSALATIIYVSLNTEYQEIVVHVPLFFALGICSSVASTLGQRLGATGDSSWLAATNLPGNLLSSISLAFVLSAPQEIKVTVILVSQILGASIYGIAALRKMPIDWRNLWAKAAKSEDFVADTRASSSIWFLLKSFAGYGSIVALQTITLTLPGSALATLGVVMRVVTGLTTVITNATLPRLLHMTSLSAVPVYRFLVRTSLVLGGILLIVLACESAIPRATLVLGLLIIAWFQAALFNAGFGRVAIKFLAPSVSLATILTSVTIPVLMWILLGCKLLDFSVVLIAFIALDFIPGLFMSIKLGKVLLSTLGTAIVVIAVVSGLSFVLS